jgi:uncharacterized membrane protein YbhN (UPF0104 family)
MDTACLCLLYRRNGHSGVAHPRGMALDPQLSRPTQYFSSALVVLVNIVAPTPGGMGIGEAAASKLLQQSGGGGGAECMFLARLMIISWSLLMGTGYLIGSGEKRAEGR